MLRVQSYWNLCFSCLSPTPSSWRLGLTSGTQVWAPSSLCSHSGVCSGRSSLLQVAGGTPASRCASELRLCALRDPTGVGVPPEGDIYRVTWPVLVCVAAGPTFPVVLGWSVAVVIEKLPVLPGCPPLFLSLERTAFDWGCFSSSPLVFLQL